MHCATKVQHHPCVLCWRHPNCRVWRMGQSKWFVLLWHSEDPMVALKAEKKLEVDMWNMYYNLSTTTNYTLDRHWLICAVCLQKKKILWFFPRLRFDLQAVSVCARASALCWKTSAKSLWSETEKIHQSNSNSFCHGWQSSSNERPGLDNCLFFSFITCNSIIALGAIPFRSICANWQSRVPTLTRWIVLVCKSPLTLISFSTGL